MPANSRPRSSEQRCNQRLRVSSASVVLRTSEDVARHCRSKLIPILRRSEGGAISSETPGADVRSPLPHPRSRQPGSKHALPVFRLGCLTRPSAHEHLPSTESNSLLPAPSLHVSKRAPLRQVILLTPARAQLKLAELSRNAKRLVLPLRTPSRSGRRASGNPAPGRARLGLADALEAVRPAPSRGIVEELQRPVRRRLVLRLAVVDGAAADTVAAEARVAARRLPRRVAD